MLSEYPHTTMKVTSSLHCLVALGIIAANAHAHYKMNNSFQSLLSSLVPGFSTSVDIFFGPQIAIGIYILILATVGTVAGSRKKNKFVVNNFKFFYLILNTLSVFLFSLCGGTGAFLMLQLISFIDPFNISIHIKATLGLMATELLLAIFSIVLICISGPPGENQTIPTHVPATVPATIPSITIQHDAGPYKPPNTQSYQFSNGNNQWGQQQPPSMW